MLITPDKLKDLLTELKDTNLVRVTGSYADGTATIHSDIDFYVKEDKPDQPYTERNMLVIINLLAKYGIRWVSTNVGYISTIKADNENLPVHLEFADHFNPRANRLPKVNLLGVEFKTY